MHTVPRTTKESTLATEEGRREKGLPTPPSEQPELLCASDVAFWLDIVDVG